MDSPKHAWLARYVDRLHILTQLLDAEPSWLVADSDRFGAPDFLWRQMVDQCDEPLLRWMEDRPAAQRLALVVAWRQWRRKWIEGEWRTE